MLTDLDAGDVDVNLLRNRSRQALDFDLASDEIEQAALGPNADGDTVERDVDPHPDALRHVDAHEVDVLDSAGDRIESAGRESSRAGSDRCRRA